MQLYYAAIICSGWPCAAQAARAAELLEAAQRRPCRPALRAELQAISNKQSNKPNLRPVVFAQQQHRATTASAVVGRALQSDGVRAVFTRGRGLSCW